jgi:hypothetical protein
MATKIVTKNSSTASAVPTASDLVQGELAVNVADKRLFTEDNAGAIVELGTNPSGNVTFQDNGKAIFGAGSDLQIYHNATSNIIDSSAATLAIQAPQFVVQDAGGTKNMIWVPQGGSGYEVQLAHDGTTKLATTSTGIDVTGTATMDGLTVDGTASFNYNGNENLFLADTANTSRSSFQVSGTANYFNANIDSASHGYYVWRSSNAYTERMRIDSSGNVGIGTSSPASSSGYGTLSINGTTGGQLAFQTGGSAKQFIFSTSTDLSIYNQEAGNIKFVTNNTERMRIDSSGNLLVGNTSTSVTTDGVIIKPNGETFCSIPSLNTLHVYNTTLGSYRFYVSANGGIYNYSGNNVNLSDEREKKNIEPLESQWDSLKQWSLKKFHYNADADSENKKYGVIAQEVETHNPEVIDEFNVDDETTRMAVKEQQMMWMAIKALQEAQTRIETLEARVTELENN